MALFWQEMKKIWRPGILLALAVLAGLYWYTFPSFYVTYFCNGPTAQAQYDLAADWLEKYGPSMERSERAELDGQLAETIETFNEQLAAIPGAAEAGVTDYESLDLIPLRDSSDPEDIELFHAIMDGTNYYELKVLENYMANYDWSDETPWSETELYASSGAMRQARILELEQGSRGFLPNGVVESTVQYAKDLATWLVLSVVLLLSPTLVRERLHRTQALQWASRRGRRTLNTQFAAGLVSALALTMINIALYAIPFLGTGALALADCPLFHWSRSIYTWFGGTYGQYLLLLAVMLLVLGLAAGGLTLFLSQYSGNYIAMLLKAIPLFVAAGALLGPWLMDRPLYFRAFSLGSLYVELPEGVELVCLALLVILGLGLCGAACHRQRRRELA